MTLDGIRLEAPTESALYLELGAGQLFRVNWPARQLELVQEQLPDDSDASELARYLTRLNHEHRLVIPYVPLYHFNVPFSDPQWPTYTNGFYETARERILYARDLPDGARAQIQLAVVKGDQVYFYHRDYPTVWRVDAITGKVNRRYRLSVVAGQYAVSGFDILGLSDVRAQPLAARYLEGRILLVGAEQGRKMHAVSLTQDKQALWLFAPDSGRLFRQPLLTLEQMRGLFGNGRQQVRRDDSNGWQGRWRQWSFAGVTAQGSGLRGVTREGVILELLEGQPVRVTGVEQLFFDESSAAKLRKQKLTALLARLAHASFLTTGQVGDICSWYDTQLRRRFFTTLSAEVPSAAYLGTRKGANPLLHDGRRGLMFSNRSGDWWGREHDLWAKVNAALRDDEVLAIEGRGRIVDLLPLIPDGVTTLVLGYAQGLLECHVSPEAWMRLDCLIVDFDSLASGGHLLSMELSISDHWLIILVDGHLMLIDSSDGRCLVLRGAEAHDEAFRRQLRLDLGFSGERLALSLADLMAGIEPGVATSLWDHVDKGNEV